MGYEKNIRRPGVGYEQLRFPNFSTENCYGLFSFAPKNKMVNEINSCPYKYSPIVFLREHSLAAGTIFFYGTYGVFLNDVEFTNRWTAYYWALKNTAKSAGPFCHSFQLFCEL